MADEEPKIDAIHEVDVDNIEKPRLPYFSTIKRWRKIKHAFKPEQDGVKPNQTQEGK